MNINKKDIFFDFIDKSIKQAELDMDRLKNTPFAMLPINADTGMTGSFVKMLKNISEEEYLTKRRDVKFDDKLEKLAGYFNLFIDKLKTIK